MRSGVLCFTALLVATLVVACGDESQSSNNASSGSSSSGAGGHGGSGGSGSGGGGMGGAGGGQAIPPGPPAMQIVNAGNTMKSPSYRMVHTLGQPTQNQGKTTSPSYRMQGGLIGANGSLP